MTQPDPVLRGAVKQYLAELPADDRAALISELPSAGTAAETSYPATWGYQSKPAD
ncbi:hypothetical protein [Mycolicibacterium lutetiense]